MCPAAQRSDDAQLYVDQLCQGEARVAQANTFIQAFLALVRERRGGDLEAWRATVMQSEIEELARFAQGLQEDLSAIQAGLTLEWSNGITEGQIHRIPSGAPTLPVNWLRVLDSAESSQVDQRVGHHLHPIVSLLDAFKS